MGTALKIVKLVGSVAAAIAAGTTVILQGVATKQNIDNLKVNNGETKEEA